MSIRQLPSGFVRRMAERIAGPLLVRRRLPPSSGGGILFASGRVGGLRYLLKPSKVWDPQLLKAAHLLVEPSAVVWDVGANVGLFAKAAAFHAGASGQVVAFEPDVDAIALLRRTAQAQLACEAPISIIQMAISDLVGHVEFAIARRARSSNAIVGFGSTQMGSVAETRIVPCATLDAMLEDLEPPQILKIDVEGAEVRVLQGGRRMLSEIRPWIHCEVTEENEQQVTQLLRRNSYRIFDASTVGRAHSDDLDRAPYDTIAIPSEQYERYAARVQLTGAAKP